VAGFGVFLILIGIFVLAAIGFQWDWFLRIFRVEGVFELLGKTGATVFYIVLGLGAWTLGILMLFGIVD
jgi:hypothetical protein